MFGEFLPSGKIDIDGPPNPLQETLERLVEPPDETVLSRRNDRVPQFLYQNSRTGATRMKPPNSRTKS